MAQTIYALNRQHKELERTGGGYYQWRSLDLLVQAPPPPPSVPTPAPIRVDAHPIIAAGERLGDTTMDAELKELDEALSALARISGVVERLRARLAKLAELKKLLGE